MGRTNDSGAPTDSQGELLSELAKALHTNGLTLVRRSWPILAAFVALKLLEWFVLSRRDLLVPLAPDHALAPFIDSVLARLFLGFEIILIGVIVARLLSDWRGEGSQSVAVPHGFLLRWSAITAGFVVALALVDVIQIRWLFLGDEPPSAFEGKAVSLLAIYAELALAYCAIRLFVAAPAGAGWGFTAGRSLGLFMRFLLVYLAIGNVLLAVIMFSPPVAVFWFLLDELSSLRFIIGELARIAADTAGAFTYALFAVLAARSH